jgi:hypothetical protein
MSKKQASTTWQEDPNDVILVSNRTGQNFILELPTGRCRLDAGRKLRTLRSILKIGQVKQLVDAGQLVIEKG